MKHSAILFASITLFSTTHYTYNAQPENVNQKITTIQQSIDTIIAQSNLDPIVAQALTDEINNLSDQAQANILQDIKEIQVAAAFTSVLEAVAKIVKSNPNLSGYTSLISDLKDSTRANTVQKLLIGAYPGQFKDELYYTDPYTESIGFTANDFVFNAFFTSLVQAITPTSLGTALSLSTTPTFKQALATKVIAGLVAHCAWLLQKQFIIAPAKQAQSQQIQA